MMSHLPRFYEIFPYGPSRSGVVTFNKKLLVFQTAVVLLACTSAIVITFVDSYVILKNGKVALYLIYLARRLAFVIAILLSYIPIIDMKFTARRLLNILSSTSQFDASVKTLHSRLRTKIDCTFLLIMVTAVGLQELGNYSGIKGHVKIVSNFFMNLLVYTTLSYYRRILFHIGDKFDSIDLNSSPKEISRRHAILYQASKAVIKMFSLPVLGIVLVSGIYLSSNLLYILGNRRQYWLQFSVSSCYLAYYAFLVCEVVVGSCTCALNGANRVTSYMVNTCLTSENPKTIKIFRYHSNFYGNLELRPLGLFVLENNFLTRYFGAIVSYVAVSLDYLGYIQN